MADVNSSIFNAAATEKLRSPDDLDKYVRVTNPSVWVVLAACALLLAGLFCWGAFGTVATNVEATGTSIHGKTLCFLDSKKASKVHVGDLANVAGSQMTVAAISKTPNSRDEVREVLGNDYLVEALVEGDWAHVVTLEGDAELESQVPLSVTITTERVAPLALIFGAS